MPTWTTLSFFLAATIVLLLIPGPAVLYIIARGLHQGRRAALVSVLGVNLGDLCHVTAATVGLSALLLSSALAFTAVKYVGAAYLIYLGVRTLLARGTHQQLATPAPKTLPRVCSQGFLVGLLNPKTALFFLAFLPQFVDPARGVVAGQMLVLGGLFVALAACTNSVYAFLAGTMGQWLKGSVRFLRIHRYVTVGVYLALGVTTAFVGTHHAPRK